MTGDIMRHRSLPETVPPPRRPTIRLRATPTLPPLTLPPRRRESQAPDLPRSWSEQTDVGVDNDAPTLDGHGGGGTSVTEVRSELAFRRPLSDLDVTTRRLNRHRLGRGDASEPSFRITEPRLEAGRLWVEDSTTRVGEQELERVRKLVASPNFDSIPKLRLAEPVVKHTPTPRREPVLRYESVLRYEPARPVLELAPDSLDDLEELDPQDLVADPSLSQSLEVSFEPPIEASIESSFDSSVESSFDASFEPAVHARQEPEPESVPEPAMRPLTASTFDEEPQLPPLLPFDVNAITEDLPEDVFGAYAPEHVAPYVPRMVTPGPFAPIHPGVAMRVVHSAFPSQSRPLSPPAFTPNYNPAFQLPAHRVSASSPSGSGQISTTADLPPALRRNPWTAPLLFVGGVLSLLLVTGWFLATPPQAVAPAAAAPGIATATARATAAPVAPAPVAPTVTAAAIRAPAPLVSSSPATIAVSSLPVTTARPPAAAPVPKAPPAPKRPAAKAPAENGEPAGPKPLGPTPLPGPAATAAPAAPTLDALGDVLGGAL